MVLPFIPLFAHIPIIFFVNRHSGMLLAAFGKMENSTVNMLACLYLLGALVEVKNLLFSTFFRPSRITVSFTSLMDMLQGSPVCCRCKNLMEVSQNICYYHDKTISFLLVGSPWGAGTFAGTDERRQPTELELEMAAGQGKAFYQVVSRVQWES